MAAAPSVKRALIEKSNSTIVVVTSVACFVVVFSLVASWSLLNQFQYQARIIGEDQKAQNQLTADLKSVRSLEASYSTFVSTPTNAIGGNPQGTGPQDGDNAKIILDALPSKYDYPALVTSLENILTSQAVQIQSIAGTDDAANQVSTKASASPQPQPMPFQVVVNGNYGAIQNVVSAFERSIRPFQVTSLEISGDQSQLTMTIAAQTYWQPAKTLDIRTEVVR